MFSRLVLALVIAVLVFFLIYAPVLNRLGPIFRTMSKHWQWEQRAGHREVVNGVIYDKQPWWTYLYWYWRGYPPYLLNYTPGVLVLLGLAFGFALLRGDDMDVFLLLSFFLPFCYLSFYLSFKMFRYADILEPPLVMLAASFISAASSTFRKREITVQAVSETPPPARGRPGGGRFCDTEGPPSPSPSLQGRGIRPLSGRWRYISVAAFVVLVAVLIGAMVHSTGSILAEKENRYKAVARYLSPKLTGEETVFVWGYTNVMSWYLDEDIRIIGGFHSAAFMGDYLEADYIVVDPLMVSKWPDDPLIRYLEDSQAEFTEHSVGGFKLYTRRWVDS